MNEDKQGGRGARDGELFRLLAENVVDYAIFIVDAEGLVQTWGHGAARLLGYSEGEILGRTADVFFTPEDVLDDVPRREMQEAIDTGRGEDDRWHVRKDGTRFWVSGVMTPLRDEGGKLRGFAKIMRDRTDWWHAERDRREGEGRHRAILESITDAFFALGRDWRFTYVNRKAEDLLGRTRGDLLGKHLWEEYAPALGTEFERSYRRAMDEGVTVTFEEFYPPLDRWYEVHAYPSPDGLSVYFRDVNERKRVEAELRASEGRRRLALDSAELGTWTIDPATNVLTSDERFGTIFLGSPAPIGLEEAFAVIHPEDRERVRASVAAAMSPDDPAPYIEEYRVVHPDGTIRWVFAKGRSNFEPTAAGRRLVSFDGTVGDITGRKRSEEAIRAAKDEAEAANRAKDQFLAVLSHELRTPLNPILLAASSMLERSPDPEEVRPTLEMIRQNVKLQARLIDDLLDVMRIVQGKMPLHWGVSDCHALIEQSVEICRSEFQGKAQGLVLDLAAEHHHVNADSARLHQVLWNLVRNAVKFTPEGGDDRRPHPQRGLRGAEHRHRGGRHRDRHRAGRPADDLGPIPAGGDDDHPSVRRARAGPGHLQGRRRCPRRDAGRRERGLGPGDDIPGLAEDDGQAADSKSRATAARSDHSRRSIA